MRHDDRAALPRSLAIALREFPVAWERRAETTLGMLEGRNSEFAVSLVMPRPNLFVVRSVIVEQRAEIPYALLNELCMRFSFMTPTASYCIMSFTGSPVGSIATVSLDQSAEIDPRFMRNAVKQSVRNAELIAPAIRALNAGATLEDAQALRAAAHRALCEGPSGLPHFIADDGPPPCDDVTLLDRCEQAAANAGWHRMRTAGDQLAIRCVGSVNTFVDVHAGSLIVSAYPLKTEQHIPAARRDVVAELLDLILDLGVPFGLTLDFQSGVVLCRTHLDLTGLSAIPSSTTLCDAIQLASGGAASYLHAIRRVAFDGIDAPRAVVEQEALHEQLTRGGATRSATTSPSHPKPTSGSLRDRIEAARRQAS